VRCAALLQALAVPLLVVACGSSDSTSAGASSDEVRAALEARLLGKKLSYRWVVCLRTERSFAGSQIFRCNVNFGEPHIVRYCATLDAGQFVTNREQPKMRCGRDATQEIP
jgi:hypothetical protein